MVTEGKPSRSRADVARFNPSVELPEEEEGERREGWNTSGVNSLSAEAAANSPEVPRITCRACRLSARLTAPTRLPHLTSAHVDLMHVPVCDGRRFVFISIPEVAARSNVQIPDSTKHHLFFTSEKKKKKVVLMQTHAAARVNREVAFN